MWTALPRAAVLAATVLVTGCGGPAAPHDASASDPHLARREAQQERLRAALGAAWDQPVSGLEAADAERGRAVWDARCKSCHGTSGKGDGIAARSLNPRPTDLTDPLHLASTTDAARVAIIREGVPGTAMPGFASSLTEAEILDVTAWIVALGAPAP